MRCINIKFRGYKRLAEASCNTDGKMIAFVGPNEAGKSSVLQGLSWLSEQGDDLELPRKDRNRSAPPTDEEPVVQVRFALTEDDLAPVVDMLGTVRPLTYTVKKYADGRVARSLDPKITRPGADFAEALQLMDRILSEHLELAKNQGSTGTLPNNLTRWSAAAHLALADVNTTWQSEWDGEFDELCEWLRLPIEAEDASGGTRHDEEGDHCASLLEDAREVLLQPHPGDEAATALAAYQPEFTLFSNEDRDLSSSYDIGDSSLREDPPLALENLLWLSELDLEELWEEIEGDNLGAVRTMERRANEKLTRRLGSRWRQEQIEIAFNVSGQDLEILVIEKSVGGADTPLSERSDGLRSFVSLVAFLARHDFEVPPILLVDEAETHLHYDAQADLVEVLSNDVEATQVFYTTHSPGCLPRDLGTGIRLVVPSGGNRDASALRNDFWTNSRPGFTPLLFAMGAGAAAFSACRRAVLTEGAADMILLPTLFRIATGLDDLNFQVAPGIANQSYSDLEVEAIAARVVYLLDGDSGGTRHKARLAEMGVAHDRLFQLSKGKAAEDFVLPERYLSVVNSLLAVNSDLQSAHIRPEDLDGSLTVSKAVAEWCKKRRVKAPGKPAVASALVGSPEELTLTDEGCTELNELYGKLNKKLGLN